MLRPKYTIGKLIEDLKRFDPDLGICTYSDDLLNVIVGVSLVENNFEEQDHPYYSYVDIESHCMCEDHWDMEDYCEEISESSKVNQNESSASNLSSKISVVPNFTRQSDWNS